MLRLSRHFVLVVAGLSLPLASCAGMVKGEIDDTAVPPLLSGGWTQFGGGGDSDASSLLYFFTSYLDGCNAQLRMIDAQTEEVDRLIDEADERDVELSEAIEATRDAINDNLPAENYWEVTGSMLVDGGDAEDADGETFDVSKVEGSLLVCHRFGEIALDDEGKERFADCYRTEEGELEVLSIVDEGTLQLHADVEMRDDEDDRVGDIELDGSAAYCEGLDDSYENLFEAFAELSEKVGGFIGEGEGEGDVGEGGFCTEHADCFDAREICDAGIGECADPEEVNGTCQTAFDNFFERGADSAGPLIVNVDGQLGSFGTDCVDAEFLLDVTFFDAEGDVGGFTVSDVEVAVSDGEFGVAQEVFVQSSSNVFIVVCATSEFLDEIAFRFRDDDGNFSNVSCAEQL